MSTRAKRTSKNEHPKIVFITGGVISSLGKGLSGASLALLLKRRGFKVKLMKMDPYLNVDPGTMSPFQHGEVFVTEDGAETDLDLGHYERFTDVNVMRKQSISTGQIYERVLARERKGDYLGGTVQIIPHITNAIKEHILDVASDSDITLVEIGGTVGDIESLPFLEAARQMRFDLGEKNVAYIHLTLVPWIAAAGELKTKPTQHSVQELRRIGIQPDILLCRTDRDLPLDIKAKIGLFANIATDHVITAKDVDSIYKLPLVLYTEGLDAQVCKHLALKSKKPDLSSWNDFIDRIVKPERQVVIGIVGKYVDLKESYKSLNEALIHAGAAHRASVKLVYIDAETLEGAGYANVEKRAHFFAECNAILVPGGFGARGVEGKIRAIEYARMKKIPYFGICLGMQLMAVEFARNVCGLKGAHSAEFVSSSKKHPIIVDYMIGQEYAQKGGSMRLGSYDCKLSRGSISEKAYGRALISERHRHRLEFQNKWMKSFERKGLKFTGLNPAHKLVEIMELAGHPHFLGCQFHPEFKSRPERPHPLFKAFIGAAIKNS